MEGTLVEEVILENKDGALNNFLMHIQIRPEFYFGKLVALPGTAQVFVRDRQNWNFSEK